MDEQQGHNAQFQIVGMSCTNCARRVEQALAALPGVEFASVNLATATGFVRARRVISFEELRQTVTRVGYQASQQPAVELEAARYRRARRQGLLAWAITLPLSVLMALHMLGGHGSHGPATGWWGWFPWLELAAGLLLLATAGRDVVRGAWIALVHRHTNLDTLIVAGALAALLSALLHVLGPGPAGFGWLPQSIESFGALAAMMLTLHLTGRYLESRLRDRAVREIRALLRLQVRDAWVVDEATDRATQVPLDAVKPGALVLVRPGELIPVDGEVVQGRAAVDESMITGEPLPVAKAPGASVTGGSLDLTGALRIQVTRVGRDTFLAQLQQLVQEASGAKVPIQALADRITAWFVPAILLLAVAAGLVWYFIPGPLLASLEGIRELLPWTRAGADSPDPLSIALFVFASTILIACPCALGLATPVALARSLGLAVRHGLIIRNAEVLQTARQARVVLLDKTGTLTRGEPRVVRHTLPPEEPEVVAAIEAGSHHPLARAIAALATRPPVGPLGGIEAHGSSRSGHAGVTIETLEQAGEGVAATVAGRCYFIGRPRSPERYAAEQARGQTVVEVVRDGVVQGALFIADPVREEARPAVAALQELGLLPVMATGDQATTARVVAADVGIEQVHAGLRPADKLELVRRLQAERGLVVMVGDGINDAAALKGAAIGVALGSGLDLALQSADVVIVRGGLDRLPGLLRLSRRAYAAIRQNLFWAFLFNLVAIPLAVAGLLHPILAEAAMLLSSITVILNALRIRPI